VIDPFVGNRNNQALCVSPQALFLFVLLAVLKKAFFHRRVRREECLGLFDAKALFFFSLRPLRSLW